jgi:hypothetical protein
MDKDGGLAAHEAQQAEREADHEARRARLNPTETTTEETVEEESKPKRTSRVKKTAKKS